MSTIAEIRRERMMGYYDRVAEKFGVSVSYVQKIAYGKRSTRTEKAWEIYKYMMSDLEVTEGMTKGMGEILNCKVIKK